MHNGYAHQVEHVRLCVKKTTKEHKVTYKGIEPKCTKLYPLQLKLPTKNKTTNHNTPQNRSLRSQKFQQLVEVQ